MSSVTLFGVAVTERAGRTQVEEVKYLQSKSKLGRPVDLRYSFSSTLSLTYTASPMSKDEDWLSLWSFKLDPDRVAAGAYDARWTAFLDTIPRDGNTRRVVYYQEPADNMSGPTYVKAFNRLAGLKNRSDVLLGENLTAWDFDAVRNASANGRAYVSPEADFIGLSLFANDTDPNVNRDALGRAYRTVRSYGIEFGLSSIGISSQQSPSQRGSWMQHLADLASNAAAHGHALDHVVSFSSDVVPASWVIDQWWMDGSPSTLQQWRDFYDTTWSGPR